VKKNLLVRGTQLFSAYSKAQEKTAFEADPTLLSFEYGHVNSWYTDNKFAIAQNFAFPTVYAARKKVLQSQTSVATASEKVQILDIKRQVCNLYFEMQNLLEKQVLLSQTDSLYEQFLTRQKERYRLGDADLVEVTATESQRGEIRQQLLQLRSDLEQLSWEFARLVQSPTALYPWPDEKLATRLTIGDSSGATSHPYFTMIKNKLNASEFQLKAYRANQLPGFWMGYTNLTYVGFQQIGTDNVYFDRSRRFGSLQAGLSVPIIGTANKARIKGGKIGIASARLELQNAQQMLDTRYKILSLQYARNMEQVAYYQTQGIPQAKRLTAAAKDRMNNGEIGYLEWMVLINQSVTIQSSYLEATSRLNNTIINLNYLIP
jgi:heavy metal efflux system protein